jgi:hypothetical protein
MQRNQHNELVYSPSDLIRYMESPFASWMERLRLECPDEAIRDEPSEELTLIARNGNAHAASYLHWLKDSGRNVCDIYRDESAIEQTRQAVQDRREYQCS